MESQGHMTIVREIVRREDSPAGEHSTREGGIKDKRKVEKQVSNDQSPHVEE